MNMSLLLLRRLRIRWTICPLILMRVMQACGDSEITGETDSFFSGYLQQNSVGFAAFMVFPMLMGMCAAILPCLHDGSLAVRAGSRERLATAALACSLMVGLFASIAIGVTAIASLAIKGLFPSDARGVALSCLLMALSITVSYLIACTGSLLSRSNALAVGCGLIYGMWDFMAINVVGGGIPYLGWSLTIIGPSMGAPELVHRFATLGCELFLCVLALYVACRRMEFMPACDAGARG